MTWTQRYFDVPSFRKNVNITKWGNSKLTRAIHDVSKAWHSQLLGTWDSFENVWNGFQTKKIAFDDKDAIICKGIKGGAYV